MAGIEAHPKRGLKVEFHGTPEQLTAIVRENARALKRSGYKQLSLRDQRRFRHWTPDMLIAMRRACGFGARPRPSYGVAGRPRVRRTRRATARRPGRRSGDAPEPAHVSDRGAA